YRIESIIATWTEQREIGEMMMFLQQYGIGTRLAQKIYRYYRDQDMSPLTILQQDPYQLTYDIQGIGFKIADKIALNVGIHYQDIKRLKAGIIFVLNESIGDGHVYIPKTTLLEKADELLQVEENALLENALLMLISEGHVRTDTLPAPAAEDWQLQAVYVPSLYHSEIGSARCVKQMIGYSDSRLKAFKKMAEKEWHEFLPKISSGIALTEQQQNAVRIALINKLSILTGGPGTGKTTTLRALITALDAKEYKYVLASPTGRAAKRLSEATQRPASTIHRLLGFGMEGFSLDESVQLEVDFVVIDEVSMLDIVLFYALIRAIKPDTHLLLVGDVDQLPSVGAGDVLRDLIRSNICPVTRLNAIFRQQGGSLIIQNAHQINQGDMPILDNKGDDFFLFREADPQLASDLLVDVVRNRVPSKFGYHPIDDVQVLSPMYRTPIGVDALNKALQSVLNPPGRLAEQLLNGQIFRVGDKVMQTRNNYEKEVFNGDIGRIHSIDKEEKVITLAMDNRLVEYDWEDTDQLTLAYACSVHRSQGSEYPVVVIPVLTQHYIMLQRNLLYTAITRAKQLVVLVGTERAIAIAVRNNKVAQRWSGLDWRLQK
ncbi:MAG: ATP-dependent RecD-like DNA helicase, partial [Anaerolineae bacterium]|nr:ATP-dependent RecD-like DNA helicase [Anaerolineae bacterium]